MNQTEKENGEAAQFLAAAAQAIAGGDRYTCVKAIAAALQSLPAYVRVAVLDAVRQQRAA